MEKQFNITLDYNAYYYIAELLKDKFYRSTSITELALINTVYTQLGINSDDWMQIISKI